MKQSIVDIEGLGKVNMKIYELHQACDPLKPYCR